MLSWGTKALKLLLDKRRIPNASGYTACHTQAQQKEEDFPFFILKTELAKVSLEEEEEWGFSCCRLLFALAVFCDAAIPAIW